MYIKYLVWSTKASLEHGVGGCDSLLLSFNPNSQRSIRQKDMMDHPTEIPTAVKTHSSFFTTREGKKISH